VIGRCLVLCGLVAACSVEEAGAGADCVRSTECGMGLVCIDAVCTDDLSSTADLSEVPMLMPEAVAEAVAPDASETVPLAPDAGEMEPPPATMDAAMMMLPVDGG